MREPNRHRPSLESLEDRCCPATVRVINGILFVSNPRGKLTLTAVSANQINVKDNVTNVTRNAGNGVIVTGTNGSNIVKFKVPGGVTYGGIVLISTLGGQDVIRFKGTGGALAGNVTILSGNGGDQVGLNATGTGDLDFLGDITAVNSGGNDELDAGNAVGVTAYFGFLNLVGFRDVELSHGAPDVMNDNVTVQSFTANGDVRVATGPNLTINGNLTITTGTGDDTVIINNADQLTSAIAGNLFVNVFSGDNEFRMDPAGPQTIEGVLFFQAGPGDDSVSLNGNVVVANNATFEMGDGNNDFTGLADGNFVIEGILRINAGTGDDDISNFSGIVGDAMTVNLGEGTNTLSFAPGAAVLGALSFTAGNGDGNLLDLSNFPILGGPVTYRVGNGAGNFFYTDAQIADDANLTFGNGAGNMATFDAGSEVNGRLIYRAGNGGDLLNLFSEASIFNLLANFGNGNDSIDFGGAAVRFTGFINGSGGDNDFLNDANIDPVSPITIINF